MPRLALLAIGILALLVAAFGAQLPSEPVLPTIPLDYEGAVLPPHLDRGAIRILDNQPATNPVTDEGATLGRVLFYDTRLSQNGAVSCGSCHRAENGFSDPSASSTGFDGGHTGRNSMGLAFARYYENGQFFWDERAETLEDQVLMPIQDAVEMGMTLDEVVARVSTEAFYADLFTDAFGSTEVTAERIGRALAQFVRSMIAAESRYDVAKAAQPNQRPGVALDLLSALENEGLGLFFGPARCAVCHGTDLFVGDRARNNGLDATTTDEGAGDGRFKAPSLRNIGLTAPYMHDGRFATLAEVVEHYNSGVRDHPNLDPELRGRGPGGGQPVRLNLSDRQKQALVAFMEALTDESFTEDERWQNPFTADATEAEMATSVALRLDAPYPNPASHSATFGFELAEPGEMVLEVYDGLGRRIATLASGTYGSGAHTATLDASILAPGTYIARLRTGSHVQTTRLIVAR